jgi:hypothetical protein
MMTNHHGKEFIGFMTTAPPLFMPEWLWMKISAPKMKVNEKGEPWQAPYGLRKIEAALLDAGNRCCCDRSGLSWKAHR